MNERIAWQGLRLLLRVALAIGMIHFGISKVIPVRMPAPELSIYLLRVGELTPARMLATFLGYSPVYQRFTGLAELLGGVLLLARRTTLLGALIRATIYLTHQVLAYNVSANAHTGRAAVTTLQLVSAILGTAMNCVGDQYEMVKPRWRGAS